MSAKHKIYLANLTSQVAFYLPYTCGTLRAYAETDLAIKENCDFQPFLFHCLNGIESLAETVTKPSVLGLSVYVWNQRRSLKLARIIKEKYPECLVVLGGPQVPSDGGAFLAENSFVDILVHHEGEKPFMEILREHTNGTKRWSGIANISFRERGRAVKSRFEAMPKELDSYPSPYLLGYFEDCLEEARRLGRECAAVVETNRGCPYSCTYCDWGNNVFQKLRQFPLGKVCLEIEYLSRHLSEIYIADSNFGILPRDLEIANFAAATAKKGKLRTVQVILGKKKNERTKAIAKIMDDNGLSIFGETVGIQSLTPSVLENVNRSNLSPEDLGELLGDYAKTGLNCYVELILGLPGESKESFLETLNRVWEAKATDVRTYNLVLLPNSRLSTLEEREKWRLRTQEICIVDGPEDEREFNEAVIGSKDLTPDEYRYLRSFVLFMDILHGGKWAFYLAWYMRLSHGVPLTKFYAALYEHFKKRSDSTVIGKLISHRYFHEFNGGHFNRFAGPHSPHGVDWKNRFFMKQTFQWLCISERREELYSELRSFMQSSFPQADSQVLIDLTAYQSALMLDPSSGGPRTLTTKHRWEAYFESGVLTKKDTRYTLERDAVSRAKIPLASSHSHWFYEAAGGQYFDKIDRFTHIITHRVDVH
jgi:putative methyltransferase